MTTQTSVYDLLTAASRGRIGVDQRFIRAIIDSGEAAIPDLLRFGLENHGDDPVGLELDLVQIFRILRTPKALDYYLHLVRMSPHDLPDELVEAFIEIGAPAVEPLLALYEEFGEEEGGEVGFLLASLQVRDQRIRKLLVDRLEYDAWDAAICLGLYADPETKPALEKVLSEVPDDEENQHLRRDLQRTIEDLNREPSPHTPQPVEAILSGYPAQAPPEFSALSESERAELLGNEDPVTRAGAAGSFFNLELTAAIRERLFSLAQNDPDVRVRAACWKALMGETEDERIARAMLARLAGESAPDEERAGALIGLAMRLPREHAEALYNRTATRAAALQAMRRSLDRSYAPFFPKHLDDPDADVRREAIWGTGYLGITNACDRLKEFFEDEDFRADALFAYSLCVRGGTTRGRIKALLRKIEDAAGGLSEPEEELVRAALDERLFLRGQKPVFSTAGNDELAVPAVSPGRNDPCPCGSGKKYKKCCGA
ncbi:MAG TPA: SEC-C metal-binding domain-containing protein [Bryobacteraceae bacterium]|nr:SEC-C metal-binding domain-containing protein [Bryobacteraceae bacterium]